MAVCESRDWKVEKLKAEDITTELKSKSKYFIAREYELIEAAVLDYISDQDEDGKEITRVVTGPIGGYGKCLAVTIEGAVEALRGDIIDHMQGYEDTEDSKVYVSDPINTDDHDVKYVVATVTSSKRVRRVCEFCIMPTERAKEAIAPDLTEIIDLV